MKLFLREHVSFFVCLLLVGVALAGCGGAPSSAENMTLSVGQITDDVPFFPFYVARQENFFKAQGLTLNPAAAPSLNSGSKLATAIEANGFDIAVGTISDVFTVSKVDPQIKVIGAITNDFLLDIIVTRKFEQQAHLTATSSLADKVKALVGKRVGISAAHSSTDALVTYLFKQQGLDPQKDVVKVSVGANNPALVATLQTGRVDAVVIGLFGRVVAQLQDVGDPLISPARGDVPGMQGQLFGVLYAKQSAINAKPKAVQAFIRAIAQAEIFIQKNPGQSIPLLESYLKVDQQTARAIWDGARASMPQSPQVNQQTFDTADQFQVQAGLLASVLPYNNVVATSTINTALSG